MYASRDLHLDQISDAEWEATRMAFVSYVGKVLKDGHLSLPKKAREELNAEAGQEVEVMVRIRGDTQGLSDEAYAPLRKLIGLAKTGKRDASVQHDIYLYGKKEP